MGSLISETPYSEITATLEVLDHLGVRRDDLRKFRAASKGVQGQIAHIFQNADYATQISVVSEGVKPKKLLEPVARFDAFSMAKFVAAEHFRVDIGRKAKVQITFLWDNFSMYFVPKIEEDVPAGELNVSKLLEPSLDARIIAELGERHETYLADLWSLLKQQPNGESGPLLTDGKGNIFYIRDANGTLWTVNAFWNSGYGGWYLYIRSVESLRRWCDGLRVVSR